jgi:DNA-binding transcriptional ArsR family regulator
MTSKIDCVEFCKVLSDPTRQKILEMLLEKEKTVNEIVEAFDLTQPTVSHHLNILSRGNLLSSRRDGKQIYYRTNQDNVVQCCGKLMAKFETD